MEECDGSRSVGDSVSTLIDGAGASDSGPVDLVAVRMRPIETFLRVQSQSC